MSKRVGGKIDSGGASVLLLPLLPTALLLPSAKVKGRGDQLGRRGVREGVREIKGSWRRMVESLVPEEDKEIVNVVGKELKLRRAREKMRFVRKVKGTEIRGREVERSDRGWREH